MGITLRDILNMKEMKGAHVLAGNIGINRVVQSTTVLDAPDGIKFLKGGELIFTTMYPFTHLTSGLEWIIQELALRNVSGLGLKLDRYVKSLSEKVIKVANEYQFPIISLPPDKAWIDLMIPIMSEILNINNRQLLRSKTINEHFTSVLITKSNLKNVAELLNYYVDNPVGIYNFTENEIITFPNVDMPPKEYIINHLNSDNVRFEAIVSDARLSRVSYENCNYTVLGFESAFKSKAAIVIKEENRPISSGDKDTLLHAKNAVVIKIIQTQTENEYQQRIKQEFVSRLLVDAIDKDDLSKFRRKAWEMGVDLKDYYLVMVMMIANENLNTIYQMMNEINRLPNLHTEVISGLDKENHIVLLLPVDNKSPKDIYDIPYKIVNGIIKRVNKKYSGDKWAIGVSQVKDVYSIPKAYDQAVKSLYHGIKIGGYGQVQYYDNLGIYRLFSHPALQDEIKRYVNELLEPLRQYDKENQADLVETLKVFIENRGNYRKTAELLHVHHNTVRYRLSVIGEISHFDIQNNDVLLQYQLAFLLLPLLKEEDDSNKV